MNLLEPDLFSFAYVPDWYGQLGDGKAGALAVPGAYLFNQKPRHSDLRTLHTRNL